jgi:hypothetical protein
VEKREWIKQNFIHLYQISLKNQSFNVLKGHTEDSLFNNPELFLKSNGSKNIEKSMLISLLKKDDVEVEEIDVWDCVIKWGTGQTESLEEKNISEWNKNDFKELKNILDDIIPLIRLQDISNEDFTQKVMPYKKLFPKDLWYDLLRHYITPGNESKLNLLPSRNSGLTIINKKLILLFTSWINQTYNSSRQIKYEFKVLYRSSRDGLNHNTFHQKCDNINKTLVVGKIQNSDQLVGGYNPLDWNGNDVWKNTDKSFIFNISNRNDIRTARFSNVKNSNNAIYGDPNHLPVFGNGSDLYFGENGNIYSSLYIYNNIDIVYNSKFDELKVFQIINQ